MMEGNSRCSKYANAMRVAKGRSKKSGEQPRLLTWNPGASGAGNKDEHPPAPAPAKMGQMDRTAAGVAGGGRAEQGKAAMGRKEPWWRRQVPENPKR
jgi:hypothetical protein